jgi:ring-1,2-phenylacetyl-CoA epoxidase subunit PaaE
MRKRPEFHTLRVSALERLTADAVAITFEAPPEARDEYLFEAGQHVTVRCLAAGDDKRRTYSLCSPPGVLRIGVKQVPGGVFSAHALRRLRVGDEMEVMTPTGRFTTTITSDGARRRAAIVAGSGVTPVLSIMRTVLEREPRSSFALIYGNRSGHTVMFLDEIADLKDRFPDRLAVFHVFSREQRGSDLLTGRLDREKLGRLFDLIEAGTVDEWLACGPMPVVDAVRAALRERGVADSAVRYELFHLTTATPAEPVVPDGGAASGESSRVMIWLAGRSTSLLVPRDRDVLHQVMAVRSDVPYGCTNGMCGTCRAKVVEGEVEMRHCYALDERDQAAGFVVTCQALPRSDAVVLDYDA